MSIFNSVRIAVENSFPLVLFSDFKNLYRTLPDWIMRLKLEIPNTFFNHNIYVKKYMYYKFFVPKNDRITYLFILNFQQIDVFNLKIKQADQSNNALVFIIQNT